MIKGWIMAKGCDGVFKVEANNVGGLVRKFFSGLY